jgi:hypothetical protein
MGAILHHGISLNIQSSLLCSQYNYENPNQDIHHLTLPSSDTEVL